MSSRDIGRSFSFEYGRCAAAVPRAGPTSIYLSRFFTDGDCADWWVVGSRPCSRSVDACTAKFRETVFRHRKLRKQVGRYSGAGNSETASVGARSRERSRSRVKKPFKVYYYVKSTSQSCERLLVRFACYLGPPGAGNRWT